MLHLQRMDLNGDGLVSMEEFLESTLQDDSYCQSISAFSNVLIWIFRELLSWNNSTILYVCMILYKNVGNIMIYSSRNLMIYEEKKIYNSIDF